MQLMDFTCLDFMCKDIIMLKYLPCLKKLRLYPAQNVDNLLVSLKNFPPMPSLEELQLGGTHIKNLEGYENICNVKKLDLSHNQQFRSLKGLT